MAPGGALVVATLSLLAILLPASSSPPAGPSPTASTSSTPLPFDASASPLPPSSPRTRTWSAEAAAPPPVVDQPFHDASSPPPPPVADQPFHDAASPPPPPVADEPFRDATSPPPPSSLVAEEQYRDAASPSLPPPVVDEANRDAARVVSSGTGDDLGLQQIAKVLASLGYNEMASSATLLANSTWPGAITVFGAPDVFLHHWCAECSRRHLLLDHMALGYYPYAELAAAPAMKLPSASAGFCLDVAAQPQRGPFGVGVHHASLYVNGVMVSEPDLYDDGRYVVHGLHGFIPPLSHASCDAHAHHHHQVHLHHHRSARARSADTSAERIMIREAISRLRDTGFGFVALAMRVKFPELEKLSNLTVFALDDQVIFTDAGHGYVSAVRFHIVPGHRLTRADLLLLRPGTLLPTLAGEDQKLVITIGATDEEVRVNYIRVKEPDVVINSRVAVHGIYLPFPRLHLAAPSSVTATATPGSPSPRVVTRLTVGSAITTPTSTSSSPGPMILILVAAIVLAAAIVAVVAAIVLAAAGGSEVVGGSNQQCKVCYCSDESAFVLKCCDDKRLCNFCLRDFIKNQHDKTCNRLAVGKIVPVTHPHQFKIGGGVPNSYEHLPQYPPWYFATSVRKNSRLHFFYYNLEDLERGQEPRVAEVVHHIYPGGALSPGIQCDIQPKIRPFSEL